MEMQSSNEQEQNNSNYRKMNDNVDDSKFSWHIISIISWIIFIITIWFSYNTSYFIWFNFGEAIDELMREKQIYYIPIQMNMGWLNIFTFVISIIGFGLYLIFTTIKMNQNLYNGMLLSWSKLHFIPLLFISALYIITQHSFRYDNNYLKHIRTLLIFDLIFTVLGLTGLILIYLTMNLQCEWYFVFFIKKGVFSTFIALLWYNFFNIIVLLKSVNCLINDEFDSDDFFNFYKGTGISFSIIIGLGCLAFSFFFRDIMVVFTNFLIYVGFVLYFFTKSKSDMTQIKDDFNGYADGIIDIIMMAISFAFIPFLIIFYKKSLFE